jgi:hypothetical protein
VGSKAQVRSMLETTVRLQGELVLLIVSCPARICSASDGQARDPVISLRRGSGTGVSQQRRSGSSGRQRGLDTEPGLHALVAPGRTGATTAATHTSLAMRVAVVNAPVDTPELAARLDLQQMQSETCHKDVAASPASRPQDGEAHQRVLSTDVSPVTTVAAPAHTPTTINKHGGTSTLVEPTW